MANTKIYRHHTAEHLCTPEEIALYLQACIEEDNGDVAFITNIAPNSANNASTKASKNLLSRVNRRPLLFILGC